MNRPTEDQGDSVTLVHVAAFDWPSLPSSPPPASGHHSRDRRGGGDVRTERHTVTDGRRGSAVVQGHTRTCIHERFSLSDVATSSHSSSVRYCHGPGWTQRLRPLSRRLPGGSLQSRTIVAVLAHMLTSWVLIWGCVLYIGLQIFTL